MPTPLVRRIEILEGDVNALRQLPDQVSALAADIAALREEVRRGDEETRRRMRILHEEVLSRIALFDEGRKTRRRGKR